MSYDFLYTLLTETPDFRKTLNDLYRRVVLHQISMGELSAAADSIGGRYALRFELHDGPVLLFSARSSRAKQPDCLTVSMATLHPSPNAMMYFSQSHCAIQLFEAGADDDGIMAGDCPDYTNRIVSQDRALWV